MKVGKSRKNLPSNPVAGQVAPTQTKPTPTTAAVPAPTAQPAAGSCGCNCGPKA